MGKHTILKPLVIPGSRKYYAMVFDRLENIGVRKAHREMKENTIAFIIIMIMVLVAILYVGSQI